ncbi:MAG TPA: ATP-binding cassette domain-containing protein [Fluviicoccus sp.]|nr:ATP-binding cassette domain-containing protein [Fluviicoccus sp.]
MTEPIFEPVRLQQLGETLRAYAAQRGRILAGAEVAHTLERCASASPEESVAMAWSILFPHEALGRVPLSLAGREHFPALGWRGGSLVIIGADGDAAALEGGALYTPFPVKPLQGPVEESAGQPATTAIRAVLREHLPLFARIGTATLFINLLAVVSSVFAMQVYDRVVPNFSYPTLWALASGVVLAILFDLVFKFVRLGLMEATSKRIDEALSQYFFEKMMALKLDRRPAQGSVLIGQIRDYESVKAFLTSSTLFAMADMPFILFFIAMVAVLGKYVALVPLCLLPVCIGVGLAVRKPLERLQNRQVEESALRQGVMIEAVSGAESLKAAGAEWRFGALWQRLTRDLADNGERMRKLSSQAQYVSGAFQQLAYVLVLVAGVFAIEAGELTTGGLIACSILAQRAMGSTIQLTNILVQWQHARHALHVLDRLLSRPADDGRWAGSTVERHDLVLEDVHYAYEEGQESILTVPSLRIPAGQRIAVLGRNGSGKSTLLRLMAGLGTPSQGMVRIAGLDLQACRLGWLRQTVGFLPQEVRLFGGTLRENLTLGLDQPSEDKLRDTLRATGLDRFAARLPQGLDTLIREGGAGLSGGQKQLIGITRLLLQQPKIWLLDEPSASLDRESEQLVQSVLKNLPGDVTVIFTTHRMGWVELSQRTLVVDDGQIRADVPTQQVRSQPSRPPGRPAIGEGAT